MSGGYDINGLVAINTVPCDGIVVSCTRNGGLYEFFATNTTNNDIKLGDITVLESPMPFSSDTAFFGEGYTMLSCYVGTVGGSFENIGRFSDYSHYKAYRPDGVKQVYNMALFSPKNDECVLIAFASCFRFGGVIRFNENILNIALNCENITVHPDETIALEQVYINKGNKDDLLTELAEVLNKNHPRLEFSEIPTGWCSWLAYGAGVTSKNIYDNIQAIKKHRLDLKYIQIDDGYQTHWGDWLDFTEKFDNGVKSVCLDIKAQGFEPAMWVAPFVASERSKLFSLHPDWFVKDDNGLPLRSDTVSFGGWGKDAPWYILDMTHPCAVDYVKTVFRTMHEEWHVNYFKLDAINWAAMPYGHRYDDSKTSIQAYKMGMAAIRQAVGNSFILAANSPLWPSIGELHAMRVTDDNARSWERFLSLIRVCFRRNWQHNKLWINDPDAVLLQNANVKSVVGPDGKALEEKGAVSKNEFEVNAAYVMASGGMILSSDDVSALDDENIELLKKLLPPMRVAAKFDDDTYCVGRANVKDRLIVYLFNTDERPKDIILELDAVYDAYDLFKDKHLGALEKRTVFKNFPPHSATVLICKIL